MWYIVQPAGKHLNRCSSMSMNGGRSSLSGSLSRHESLVVCFLIWDDRSVRDVELALY
jgi:hypothetical protein